MSRLQNSFSVFILHDEGSGLRNASFISYFKFNFFQSLKLLFRFLKRCLKLDPWMILGFGSGMDQGFLTVWFKLYQAHYQTSIHMVLLTWYRAVIMTERERLHARSYSLKILIICCETHCFSPLLHIRWSPKFRFTPTAFIRRLFSCMCS